MTPVHESLNPEQWYWVATAPLERGGKTLAGPFATAVGADRTRDYMERVEKRSDFWIVSTVAGEGADV